MRVFPTSHFRNFEEKHIKLFLDKWYPIALLIIRKKQMKEKEDNQITKRFFLHTPVGREPLLLTILAIIGKHQELPRERWKLYDHAAGVLVENWEVNRHLKRSKIKHGFYSGKKIKKNYLCELLLKCSPVLRDLQAILFTGRASKRNMRLIFRSGIKKTMLMQKLLRNP